MSVRGGIAMTILGGALLGGGLPLAAEPAGPPAGRFVLGVQTHFSQGWPPGLLGAARGVHAPALRDSLPWTDGERRAGAYDFAGARARPLADACAAQQTLLLTLVPRNPLYDGGALVASDAGRRAFAAYVNALADHFGRCLIAVEIGNEINTSSNFKFAPGVDPATAYVALLRTLREQVKPRHPALAILGGSTNVVGTGFLARLAAAGMLPTVDGIVIHPYRSHGENLDVELAHLRAVLRRFGPVPPIWATEYSNNFATPEQAAPLLVKATTLMAANGVARGYWYALVDERWFRNMGLLDAQGRTKPAAQAYRLMQDRLLPAGRPVRVGTDPLAFLYRFGANRWVIWGAPRPITFSGGAATSRDAQGRVLSGRVSLDEAPRIVEGATGIALGPSPVVADSLLQYGAAPWSYLAQTPDGVRHPLALLDTDYASAFANRFYRPLRIDDSGAAPAGDGAKPIRAVVRYTAPAAQAVTLAACFTKQPGGDGVDVTVEQDGRELYHQVLTERLAPPPIPLKLASGATLEIAFGPNHAFGHDALHYRVRLLRPGAAAPAACD